MMLKRRYTICLLALLAITAGLACKKVIQVDLHDATSRVVIEGEITDLPGTYQVKITPERALFERQQFPSCNRRCGSGNGQQ